MSVISSKSHKNAYFCPSFIRGWAEKSDCQYINKLHYFVDRVLLYHKYLPA